MLFELGELDRLTAWAADAAVQGVLDHERTERLVFLPTKDLDHEGVRARVVAARTAAAEATCPERRPLADPAVQPYAPLTAAPRPAEPT